MLRSAQLVRVRKLQLLNKEERKLEAVQQYTKSIRISAMNRKVKVTLPKLSILKEE